MSIYDNNVEYCIVEEASFIRDDNLIYDKKNKRIKYYKDDENLAWNTTSAGLRKSDLSEAAFIIDDILNETRWLGLNEFLTVIESK